MEFKLWLESIGGDINKSNVKDLCARILSLRDYDEGAIEQKAVAFSMLADMYEDVGNGLKADMLRRMVEPVNRLSGGMGRHNPMKRWSPDNDSLLQAMLKIGAKTGALSAVFDTRRKPFSGVVYCSLAGDFDWSDIFESRVASERFFTNRWGGQEDRTYEQDVFRVAVMVPVGKKVLDMCSGKQMSVRQYFEESGRNLGGLAMNMGKMRLSISDAMYDGYRGTRDPGGHDMGWHKGFDDLSGTPMEIRDHRGGTSKKVDGVLVNINLLHDRRLGPMERHGDEAIVKPSFVKFCKNEIVKSSNIENIAFLGDYESYDSIRHDRETS